MSDKLKIDPGSLAESSYDQSRGRISGSPNEGLATGPKESVSGEVQETPDESSERATEAVERAQKREG